MLIEGVKVYGYILYPEVVERPTTLLKSGSYRLLETLVKSFSILKSCEFSNISIHNDYFLLYISLTIITDLQFVVKMCHQSILIRLQTDFIKPYAC